MSSWPGCVPGWGAARDTYYQLPPPNPPSRGMTEGQIRIRKARQNNLASVDVDIPRNRLVAITGVSGSGKSSLAFDTLFREGQRRFLETLSAYARQFLGRMEKPDVDSIEGLAPAIAGERPSTLSTSGFSMLPRNCRA